jgi:hypothetical protein
MSTTSPPLPRRYPGRLLLWLGFALPFLGIAAYVVQMWAERLYAPWYVPIAATLGVVLVLVSLVLARTVWRVLVLLLVVALAGFEWYALMGMRAPAYTGPVADGQPMPSFVATEVDGKEPDGKTFTQADLAGDKNNVLVFFRGRW